MKKIVFTLTAMLMTLFTAVQAGAASIIENTSIATNEGNATVIIFAIVIGIAAAAGVVFFIFQRNNRK